MDKSDPNGRAWFRRRGPARIRRYVIESVAWACCRSCGTALTHPSAVSSVLATGPMRVIGGAR